MEKQFLVQLQQEESELSRKLDAIRGVIAVYAPHAATFLKPMSTLKVASALAERAVKASKDNYAKEVRAIAADVIRNSPSLPVPTKVIVDRVLLHGMEIRGQNALNAVSALLSRSEDFVANGRSGWTLAEMNQSYGFSPNENEAPNGNAAGASEAGGGATPPYHQPNPFD